jgi:hypothetical protein
MENIILGLLFMAIGILLKFFPNLLAGYSQLSQGDKENAIQNGLPTFGFLVFGLMGIIIFSGYFISIWLELPALPKQILMIVTLLGIITIIVGGNILVNKRSN